MVLRCDGALMNTTILPRKNEKKRKYEYMSCPSDKCPSLEDGHVRMLTGVRILLVVRFDQPLSSDRSEARTREHVTHRTTLTHNCTDEH